MSLEFAATQPPDLGAITALLQDSFGVGPDAPILDRSYLEWKYYQPGPRWEGSRSYALRDGERIVAHAAVWPFQTRVNNRLLSGIGFGDWVSDKQYPGIGLTLLKRLIALAPMTLVTGGGDITRRILPRMGFEHWADRAIYSKIMRPVRQFRTRKRTVLWKEVARLGRNAGWSLKSASSLQGWTAEPAMPNEEILSSSKNRMESVYNSGFLTFLLSCPIARFQFLVLRRSGELRGYCVTSSVGGQGRVADLNIDSEDDESWSGAVAAILQTFKKDRTVSEVMAFGSVAYLDKALEANGFQNRDSRPMVVFDPGKTLTGSPVPLLGMLEDDASFVYDPNFPYLT